METVFQTHYMAEEESLDQDELTDDEYEDRLRSRSVKRLCLSIQPLPKDEKRWESKDTTPDPPGDKPTAAIGTPIGMPLLALPPDRGPWIAVADPSVLAVAQQGLPVPPPFPEHVLQQLGLDSPGQLIVMAPTPVSGSPASGGSHNAETPTDVDAAATEADAQTTVTPGAGGRQTAGMPIPADSQQAATPAVADMHTAATASAAFNASSSLAKLGSGRKKKPAVQQKGSLQASSTKLQQVVPPAVAVRATESPSSRGQHVEKIAQLAARAEHAAASVAQQQQGTAAAEAGVGVLDLTVEAPAVQLVQQAVQQGMGAGNEQPAGSIHQISSDQQQVSVQLGQQLLQRQQRDCTQWQQQQQLPVLPRLPAFKAKREQHQKQQQPQQQPQPQQQQKLLLEQPRHVQRPHQHSQQQQMPYVPGTDQAPAGTKQTLPNAATGADVASYHFVFDQHLHQNKAQKALQGARTYSNNRVNGQCQPQHQQHMLHHAGTAAAGAAAAAAASAREQMLPRASAPPATGAIIGSVSGRTRGQQLPIQHIKSIALKHLLNGRMDEAGAATQAPTSNSSIALTAVPATAAIIGGYAASHQVNSSSSSSQKLPVLRLPLPMRVSYMRANGLLPPANSAQCAAGGRHQPGHVSIIADRQGPAAAAPPPPPLPPAAGAAAGKPPRHRPNVNSSSRGAGSAAAAPGWDRTFSYGSDRQRLWEEHRLVLRIMLLVLEPMQEIHRAMQNVVEAYRSRLCLVCAKNRPTSGSWFCSKPSCNKHMQQVDESWWPVVENMMGVADKCRVQTADASKAAASDAATAAAATGSDAVAGKNCPPGAAGNVAAYAHKDAASSAVARQQASPRHSSPHPAAASDYPSACPALYCGRSHSSEEDPNNKLGNDAAADADVDDNPAATAFAGARHSAAATTVSLAAASAAADKVMLAAAAPACSNAGKTSGNEAAATNHTVGTPSPAAAAPPGDTVEGAARVTGVPEQQWQLPNKIYTCPDLRRLWEEHQLSLKVTLMKLQGLPAVQKLVQQTIDRCFSRPCIRCLSEGTGAKCGNGSWFCANCQRAYGKLHVVPDDVAWNAVIQRTSIDPEYKKRARATSLCQRVAMQAL